MEPAKRLILLLGLLTIFSISVIIGINHYTKQNMAKFIKIIWDPTEKYNKFCIVLDKPLYTGFEYIYHSFKLFSSENVLDPISITFRDVLRNNYYHYGIDDKDRRLIYIRSGLPMLNNISPTPVTLTGYLEFL